MSLAELSKAPGKVESIRLTCDYIDDPLAAYQRLCHQKPNSLLLESAEIESKDGINSMILVDAAVKLICEGQQVTVHALSENGQPVLALLHSELNDFVLESESNKLTLNFPTPDPDLDEDSKLKAPSVFDALRVVQQKLTPIREHSLAIFVGGAFAYDLFATFEQLPSVPNGKNHCPDYVFYLAETLIHIDHQKKSSEMVGSVFSGENVANNYFAISQRLEVIKKTLSETAPAPSTDSSIPAAITNPDLQVDKSDEEYCQDVIRLRENILAGDIFQVVPSRTFSLPCPDPYLAYAQLKLSNPSPYMFFMQDDDFCIFGASPESAVKYEHKSNQVEVYPIAGTRPRGKRADGSIDPDLDSRIELTLREDDKEKAEHLMLVDLARNDIARVSEPGTRHVKDLLKVDRYSHVMHLVSRVVGQLRSDLDGLHAYQACMNMGTLVGAPKVSAAQLIREVEGVRRGSYGGAIGFLTGEGDMNTCIVIRSAFVSNGTAYVQAGAGVVYDSIPQSEADETRGKAQAVLSAIMQSHLAAQTKGA
ncbi:anthranilate synthase component 1 [Paraneptunicella aestuarii]|uniref:anthranilate synthase component 1 n=1 Tax=Paraneptunicella aestuarii TaxID=2831148 RepID=UPI001E640F6A|nr:anthranilate synthase component 1 [Paraneptunicella aestuarii]UAA37346.1 anthranilate synthase component 1 [Paraneptunicella aestuarii]